MSRTRRLMLLTAALPILLVGLLCLLTYLELRQIQRNQALIAAVKRNDATAVSTLLAQGANADARNASGIHLSMRDLILDRLFGRHRITPAGPTALMVAMDAQFVRENRFSRHPVYYLEIARILLAKGANPNTANQKGETPLIIAAWLGDIETVEALLVRGANVDARNDYHGSALQYATWSGSLTCVQALLARGAAVNLKDNDGNDALGGAADQNRLDIMRVLLDHGADPRSTNNSGTTALSDMVRNGNTAGVKLLLSKGANPGATDVMGRSCLYWLRGKPHSEIALLLRQAGATR